MRRIGSLECEDCGGRHEVHLTRGGELIALSSCPASSRSGLPALARRRIAGELGRARNEIDAVEQLFTGDRVDRSAINARLDEVYRHLVEAQNVLSRSGR